ncbi:hypothetical protein [Pseudomonas viridiflava]|nr:hypothetical protein [Pseudomonas viridiflava]
MQRPFIKAVRPSQVSMRRTSAVVTVAQSFLNVQGKAMLYTIGF